jgi:hypothetical protein
MEMGKSLSPNQGPNGTPIQKIARAMQEQAAATKASASNTEVLKAADTALLDWLHCYAADQCATLDVMISRDRIKEQGGTLAYIARTRELIKEALAANGITLPEGERLMTSEELSESEPGYE